MAKAAGVSHTMAGRIWRTFRLQPHRTESFKICREIADRIPGCQFEIIKGDGSSHVVPIERPDEFNHLVTRFLVASEPALASAGGADRAAIGAQGGTMKMTAFSF